MISPHLLASIITHGIFNGDGRSPRAIKFVSKVPSKQKPVFSESVLEKGRDLPRAERKKYFAKLKEEYYRAS